MNVPAVVRTTVLLALTFAAGTMAGVGFDRHLHAAPSTNTATDGRVVLHHLETELQLDSAQRVGAEAILARHQIAIDSTWHVMQPHVRATLDSAHREILALLRPDQAQRFQALMSSMPALHRMH